MTSLGAEREPVIVRPLCLTLGQLGVALVVRIVHDVVDRIEARIPWAVSFVPSAGQPLVGIFIAGVSST
ncbi:MAG TPA: hypothetical protein VFH23_08450 [Jiangellaceae bacterium]|nr:hypothetical protein [Jiangellaceae bacterium]